LIPTRSSRRGSSTASLCCTQQRPQPLEVMLCCKTIVDGRAPFAPPSKVGALLAQSRDLFEVPWFARQSHRARGVPPIQPLDKVVQRLVDVRDELSQRTAGLVAVLIFDCLMRVPSTASSSRSQRSSRQHRSANRRNTARNAARLLDETRGCRCMSDHHLVRR
jgi:hypothetical protein